MTALQHLSDDLAAVVATAGPSVVAIHARRRIPASGLLWRPDVVVTNHHVLQREQGITVTLADGTSVGATLAGRDPTTDVAVLRLATPAGSPVLVPAPDARTGQLVLALGRPGREVTAALGVLSATGGEWRTWSGGRIDRYLRPDVAVYDGFSGGPLVDVQGRTIGMNSSALARSAAVTIPIATVARVAEQLLASGHVRRGYVGVGLQPVRLTSAIAAQLGRAQPVGLMVVSVDEGAPAAAAGMQLGDVVVAFDGTAVADPSEMLAQLGGERVGTAVPVTIVRAGTVTTLSLTIGERTSGPRS